MTCMRAQMPDRGTWEAPRRPHPLGLEPYVRRIEGYGKTETGTNIRRMAPTGEIPLIFVLGAPFEILDSQTDRVKRQLRHSFVAGLQEQVTTIGWTGRVVCIQVDLTPIGAWRMLRIDMSEI